jgi:WD40 repeat protein
MSADAVISPETGSANVNAENPWPGLLAFRETDQHYFQGRRAETEELLRLVVRERLTVLFGLSGLGKSSLLQAGIFPHLRRDQMLPIYIRLDFSSDASDLAGQVTALIAHEAAVHGIEAPQSRPGDTLWEYFHRDGHHFWSARNRPVMPLLVFDQFEELFTLGRVDAGRAQAAATLIEQLSDLVEARTPAAVKARIDEHPEDSAAYSFGRHHYKVLLSIREDFLPDLEALRERMPALAVNRLRLRRMNGEAALAVVSQARHLIDDAVATQVVRFVAADRGHTPLRELEIEPALLSVVCRELNNKRQIRGEPAITSQLLEGSQEQVLSDFYERSVADLPAAVRSFIEDRLLTVSGYRDSVALENALSIPGISRESLDRLVERRLVRREDRGGAQRIELTHDLLAGVVRVSRDSRHQKEQAERERLALAEAQEQQRQALVTAQEEERRQRDKRDLKRFRVAAGVFLLLTVAAVAAAVWAFRAQREADRLRAAAEQSADTARGLQKQAEDNADLAARKTIEARNNLTLANENEQKAREESAEAQRQREIASVALGRSWIHETSNLADAGRILEAAAYAAQALRTDPQSTAARAWIASLLLRNDWWVVQAVLPQQGQPTVVEFAPDGKRLVTATNRGAGQMWDVATGKPVGAPLRHKYSIEAAAFSPDGRRVVTASDDNTAQVWDADTGRAVGPRLQHTDDVDSAQFSPDGRRVVTASEDKTAQIWDVESGRRLGPPMTHQYDVYFASFSPDGRRVLTATEDNKAQLWDAESGMPAGMAMPHKDGVLFAAFSPDGARIVTASSDFTAQLWEGETGKPLLQLPRFAAAVTFAAFSPDGGRVITVAGNAAQVWDAETGKPVGTPLQHQGRVRSAMFSSDGRRVVTASEDDTARLWDAGTGNPIGPPIRHKDDVVHAAFSPNGRRIATASKDGTVQLWAADTSKPAGLWTLGHDRQIKSAQFSPDGRRVVTTSLDGTAKVWDAATGNAVGKTLNHSTASGTNTSPDDWVALAVFSRNGRVVTSSLSHAQVWDAETGSRIGKPLRPDRYVRLAILSPDGRYLVTCSDDRAHLLDVDTGRVLATFDVGDKPIGADFAPDGEHFVLLTRRAVQLWNVKTRQRIGSPMEHKEGSIQSLEFSADGRRVLTAASDGYARLWDATSGALVATTLESVGFLPSAALSRDGRRIVTAGADAQIWDAKSGQPIGIPLQHKSIVNAVGFSPDGQLVVTASSDTTVRIWEAGSGKPAAAALRHPSSIGSAVFSADGHQLLTYSEEVDGWENVARVWQVLIDDGSPQDVAMLADIAEAVAGYRINEFASLVSIPASEQSWRLHALRDAANRGPDQPGTVRSFIRRFLNAPN